MIILVVFLALAALWIFCAIKASGDDDDGYGPGLN